MYKCTLVDFHRVKPSHLPLILQGHWLQVIWPGSDKILRRLRPTQHLLGCAPMEKHLKFWRKVSISTNISLTTCQWFEFRWLDVQKCKRRLRFAIKIPLTHVKKTYLGTLSGDGQCRAMLFGSCWHGTSAPCLPIVNEYETCPIPYQTSRNFPDFPFDLCQ